jgi:methenyltetrahydrofolate cyclohydrolase
MVISLPNLEGDNFPGGHSREALSGDQGIHEFVERLAAAKPLPGGGCAAAFAGSLAAALGEMMAGLTEGREKFSTQDHQVREIHAKLTDARRNLFSLVWEDSAAFESLLHALKLPRQTDEEIAVRAEAIQQGLRIATETPVRTAREAFEVLRCLSILIRIGNPNARTDVAVGAQLAHACLRGAYYNVLANVPALKDRPYAENCRAETSELARKAQGIMQQIESLITGA